MSRIGVEQASSHSAQLGEGPVWDAQDQALWWVDIYAGTIHRHRPAGDDAQWDIGEDIGCVAPRESGGLVVATRSGFHLFDPDSGDKTPLTDPETHRPQSRFNDGAVDPRGRFWAGTMKDQGEMEPVSSFWRLDADGATHPGPTGMHITNGLAFAPLGDRIYCADTAESRQQVWTADYDLDTGDCGSLEPLYDTRRTAGSPDGATVDADGCYWVALVGGWQLLRITPSGDLDRVIDLPVENPTKPMFGGPDLKTLYVTSMGEGMISGPLSEQPLAGSLLAVEGHGAQGTVQPKFAG